MVKFRPWLMAAMAVSAALGLCVYLHNEIAWILTAAGITLAAFFLFLYRKEDRLKTVLVTLSVLGCIFSFSLQYSNNYLNALQYAGDTSQIIGTVIERLPNSASGYPQVLLTVTDIDRLRLKTPIRMAVTQEDMEKELELGDTVRFYGEIKRYRSVSDEQALQKMLSGRIYLRTVINKDSKIMFLSSTEQGIPLQLEKSKQRLIDTVWEVMSPEAAGIFCGMMFSETDGLSSGDLLEFRYSGFAHLLAVSGLHIQVIASMISAILGVLLWFSKHRRNVARVMTVFIIWGFILLIGCPVSAMRSGIMVTISAVGYLIRKRADTLNSLGLSMVIILLIYPFEITSVGFWMSVLATFGIGALHSALSKPLGRMQEYITEQVSYGKNMQKKRKRLVKGLFHLRKFLDGWVVGSAASIGLLPIYLFHFSYLPLGAILIGGVLGYLFFGILLFGLLFSFSVCLGIPSGVLLFGKISELLVLLLGKIVGFTAKQSLLVLPLRWEFAVVFVVFFAIGLLILNRKICKKLFHTEKRWGIGVFLTIFFCLGLLFTQYYQYNIIEVSAIGGYREKDVVVIAKNRATVFLAYGSEENGEEILDALMRRGVHRIDQIFLLQPYNGVPDGVSVWKNLLWVDEVRYNTYGLPGKNVMQPVDSGDYPLTCGMVAHFAYSEQGLNVALEYGERRIHILQDLSLVGNHDAFDCYADAILLYEPINTKIGAGFETGCLIPLSDFTVPKTVRSGRTIWLSEDEATITLDRSGTIRYP